MYIIYLHGFASSPLSTKANRFATQFRSHNNAIEFIIPDLNAPSFERLMLTAMLERVAGILRDLPADVPVYLIGSSLGGLTALHFLDRYKGAEAAGVHKAVLLAPALDFTANRDAQGDADWRESWRKAGSRAFYNYATRTERPVHFGFVRDVENYDSYGVHVPQNLLIYHGKNDESVSYQQSVRFADGRARVRLHLMASDHQLLDVTDTIFAGMLDFFDLT